jgi:phospholipid N-methyltransferase
VPQNLQNKPDVTAALPTASPLFETFFFFKQALTKYRDIGMPFPTSRSVAEKIIALMPMEKLQRIVELGSGTGRLTRVLQSKLSPDAELICVDINKGFCDFLSSSITDERISILNLPAEQLLENDASLANSVDAIVVSLQPKMVNEETRKKWAVVLEKILKPGGLLVVQQFSSTMDAYLDKSTWTCTSRHWFFDFPPFRADLYKKSS